MDKGYQPEMGARPLRRSIEQYLEDPLAEVVLKDPNGAKTLNCEVGDSQLVFKTVHEEKPSEEEEDKLLAASSGKTKKAKPKS